MVPTDSTLLERWRGRRDAGAFAELITRHAAMVFGTSLRILGNPADAEDVAQDCFLKLSRVPEFQGPSVGGWLHRVARNGALDHVRTETRRVQREARYAQAHPVADTPEWDEILPVVDEAIAALPDDVRVAVVLHFLEGKTHKVTARALGVSRSTVTRRVERGIKLVREHLRDKGVMTSLATITAFFAGTRTEALPGPLSAALKKIALAGVPRRPAPGTTSRPMLNNPMLVYGGFLAALILAGIFASRAYLSASEPTASPVTARVPAYADTVPPAPTTPVAEPEVRLAQVSAAPIETPEPSRDPPEEPPPPQPDDALTLKCIDTGGNPIEGAEVFFLHLEIHVQLMRMPTRPEELTITPFGPLLSDSEGIVITPFDGEPREDREVYAAYARVPGKLVGAWQYPRRKPHEPDWNELVLVHSMPIVGTVIVPAGFDPSDVEIRILNIRVLDGKSPYGTSFGESQKNSELSFPHLFTAKPDQSGRSTLADMPKAGGYYLAATAPGLGESQFYNLNAGTDIEVKIELEPEATIEGSVRYAPSQTPAANVSVLARPYGGRGSNIGITTPFITTTDSRGHFRFSGLPKENYSLFTYPLGNPPEWVAAVVNYVETEPGHITGPIDLWLERGAVVEGRVLEGETQTPIAGAVLVALNPTDVGQGQSIGSAKTDVKGRFQFRLPQGDSRLYFFKIPEGYVYPKDQGKKIITITPGVTLKTDVDFLLKADPEAGRPPGRATVKGRVVNLMGEPVEGVPIKDDWVYEQGEDTRMILVSLGRSDSDGRFAFSVQATGKHRLYIGREGFSIVKTDWITPQKDEVIEFPDSQLERFTGVLSGTVVDAAGLVVTGATVELGSERSGHRATKSDGDGQFVFEYVAPDLLSLHISRLGYKDPWLEVESGFHYDIELEYPDEPEEQP